MKLASEKTCEQVFSDSVLYPVVIGVEFSDLWLLRVCYLVRVTLSCVL